LLHNSGIDLCDYALLFECVIFIRKVKEGAKPQFFDPKVSSLAPYSQSKPSQSPLKAHSKAHSKRWIGWILHQLSHTEKAEGNESLFI
jgi:hypothetical protein